MTTAPPRSAVEGAESREWLRCLRADGEVREEALTRLHALLLRAARFEVERRRQRLQGLRGNELEDIAHEAADEAMTSVLAHLDDFRGLSRFTTWAYKFALLEVAVKLRRRSWQSREASSEPQGWTQSSNPGEQLEQPQLLTAVLQSIAETLTPHQRHVLTALALDGVPIDVLAEELQTTRAAVYQTLQDARRSLRRHLSET